MDPRVIPLGTPLWVEGYGAAVAADTGGLIRGNKVNLYMEDHVRQAMGPEAGMVKIMKNN